MKPVEQTELADYTGDSATGPTWGDHLRTISDRLRSGPLEDMRARTPLTPADLRKGAERATVDATFRRDLAERMEREGVREMSAAMVLALRKVEAPSA